MGVGILDREIISEITGIMGNDRTFTTPEDRLCYSYDSTARTFLPDLVVQPATVDQISAIIKLANQRQFPVIPRGAGTGLSGGSLPAAGGVVLDLSRLDRIIDLDEVNLTAEVEPGVINAQLQAEVERQGLFYPPDPASLKTCTIGGNIAECAGGPRAFKYGVTRDYLLGLEVVLATGEKIQTGGRTVKNVTGYDLTRLFCGSEGTLGVVTRAILRLLPRPETKKTALACFPDLDDAARAVAAIVGAGIIPSTLEIMDDVTIRCVEEFLHPGLPLDVEALLLIEADGPESLVIRQINHIAEICHREGAREVQVAANDQEADQLWLARRSVSSALSQLKPVKFLEDATVPRSRIPEMVRRLKEIGRQYNLLIAVFGHAGDGNLHPMIMTDRRDRAEMERVNQAIAAIFEAGLALGGTLSGEHGIGVEKAPFLKWETGAGGMAAMRSIKQALDPGNILNPLKIFDGK